VEVMTWNNIKRKYIRGLVDLALHMCFWTAPRPIADLSANNVTIKRQICSIFNVSKLDILTRISKLSYSHKAKASFGSESGVC
jgi:hypothetical protein